MSEKLENRIKFITINYNQGHIDVERIIRDLVISEEKNNILVDFLKNCYEIHQQCEDNYYSCPKAEGGCSNDGAGDECDCGADLFNMRLDLLLKEHSEFGIKEARRR